MQNKEQVFLYIKNEIEKLAKEEEDTLIREASNLEQEACDRIREETKKEMESQVEKEMADIDSQASIHKSSSLSTRKSELVTLRDSYVDTIFTKTKEKLIQFTKTEEYQNFLCNKVKQIGQDYASNNFIAYVGQKDVSFAPLLQAAYGKNLVVEAKDQIAIGGVIMEDKADNMVIDESLDSVLENQKGWFYRTSGLTIE